MSRRILDKLEKSAKHKPNQKVVTIERSQASNLPKSRKKHRRSRKRLRGGNDYQKNLKPVGNYFNNCIFVTTNNNGTLINGPNRKGPEPKKSLKDTFVEKGIEVLSKEIWKWVFRAVVTALTTLLLANVLA